MLRSEYGWEGYGIYFALLEIMFDNDETCIQRKALKAIALTNNIETDKLMGIIDLCVEEGLLRRDDKKIWSHGLQVRKKKYLEITRKRSEAGKKGMRKRWSSDEEKPDNGVITEQSETDNEVITLKEKERKEKEKENKRITGMVIDYLNAKAGTAYRKTADKTVTHVVARINEGYVYEDFVKVIDYKCDEWLGGEYAKFLRPETLFGTKFEGYYNAANMAGKPEKKLKFVNG